MQSRKSCFNTALYKKLLSRFWPMWGGMTALASLVPLIFLLMILRQGPIEDLAAGRMDMYRVYYSILTSIAPAFMLCYAALCAMAVWSYLYQHRSVSLMHTLPVTRTNLFVTGTCAGLTFMLLPLAIAGLLLLLVTTCCGLGTPIPFLECASGLVLLALLNFGFATLCAMVTGNLVALPVFYFLGNFLAVILDWLLSTFTNMFFFGVNTDYSGAVEWLSPTVYIYQHVQSKNIYEETQLDSAYYNELVGIELEGLHILLIYGIVGILLLALAWLVYRRRPSESAGDVVSLPILRPLFKLAVGVLAGLSCGQLLYAVFSIVSPGDSLIRMGVCMFVAGTVGYWIADMLVQKSLRVLKSTAFGAAVMAVLSLAVCIGVRFDVFGVEHYMPAGEEIKSVELRVNGISRETIKLTAGRDDAYIQQVLAIHDSIIQNKEQILSLGSSNSYSGYYYSQPYDTDEEILIRTVSLYYYLKDGTKVERRYGIPFTEELMADRTSYSARISDLFNDPAIQLKRIHYNEGYEVYWADIWSYNLDRLNENEEMYQDILKEPRETYLESDEARMLYNALVEDVKAGRWGFTDMLRTDTKSSWLEINFEMREKVEMNSNNTYDTGYEYITIRYTPQMTSVRQALLELGFPEFIMEIPADYLTEEEKKELTSFDPNIMTVSYGSSASFGVIGGADGPTAVFVTGG